MELNRRELATVQFALGSWQLALKKMNQEERQALRARLQFLDQEPLDEEEIDELCHWLDVG